MPSIDDGEAKLILGEAHSGCSSRQYTQWVESLAAKFEAP